MNRVDRLVAIVLLLQSRRLIRAEDIAQHFDISVRTVYRDLKALDEAGVPIAAEAGYGYSIVEGYHLPPVMFTHEEASALFIGGKLVEHLTDESLKEQIQSALLKIYSILPDETQEYLNRLQASTAIPRRANSNKNGFRDDVMVTVQDALVNRRVLKIEYHSIYRDAITQRKIEPLGLLFYSDHWHLISYCRMRQDYRDFRTDRIKALNVCDEIFSGHQNFSLKQYLKDFNKIENPQEAQVKFDKSLAQFVRDKHSFGLIEEQETDDGVVMTFISPPYKNLAKWLLSFGSCSEVIAPQELRDLMKEEAQKIIRLYGDSG